MFVIILLQPRRPTAFFPFLLCTSVPNTTRQIQLDREPPSLLLKHTGLHYPLSQPILGVALPSSFLLLLFNQSVFSTKHFLVLSYHDHLFEPSRPSKFGTRRCWIDFTSSTRNQTNRITIAKGSTFLSRACLFLDLLCPSTTPCRDSQIILPSHIDFHSAFSKQLSIVAHEPRSTHRPQNCRDYAHRLTLSRSINRPTVSRETLHRRPPL